ncbi:MAG: hypothetical protein A2V66_05105 [Ignavibacteria bacterium RBG_13_36_8]|nr:MAG: hypothetical protein A2V66_05105 [Ignavibacteria bacterium RBG_13_36_8]
MKVKKSFLLLTTILLSVFLMTNCDTSEGDTSLLVGTWILTSITETHHGQIETIDPEAWGIEETVTFSADGTYARNFIYGDKTDSYTGTWSTSGNNLTVNHQDGYSWTAPYNISGNKLTITMTDNDPETGTTTTTQEYTKR